MTTQRDGTNAPTGEDRPTTNPPDERRREPGPGGQSTMPPRRSWLWFALILLANEEARLGQKAFTSLDAKEGLKAFIEKRSPDFPSHRNRDKHA